MIRRDTENTIRSLLLGFPIITITGPRQSGKTTLAKAIFSDKPYASLEDPDVRQALKVQELETFQRFVRLCAGRTGQLLNFSSLATECGIIHNTAKAWIFVLEASYIAFQLRPHHANFSKRLVKALKLYFYDVGLASWLLGIQTPEQLETHPLRESIFETFVVAEVMKSFLNRGERPQLHFWRDSNGIEVDLLIEREGRIMPVEIKSGKTITGHFFSSLEKWDGAKREIAYLQ